MKLLQRNIVGGYYLLSSKILRGIEYVHAYTCGPVGDKFLMYIQFSPDLYTDTLGKNQESFDLSGVGSDEIAAELFPMIASEAPDLSTFAPSAQQRILASISEGMDMFDAIVTHIARLLPEYCGETFAEVITYRPELLTVDVEGSANIQRCSLE